EAALKSVGIFCGVTESLPSLKSTSAEIIVVDNLSTDRTCEIVRNYTDKYQVHLEICERLKAPCARNHGVKVSSGQVLIFIDADTVIPPESVTRIMHLCEDKKYRAGITRLVSLEPGLRAWLWWTFWDYVRCLPLPRAKAMPAFMFCTRDVFDQFGPFDEEVQIGEEWPILASIYRQQPHHFIYDRKLAVQTSSRRMDLQRFGYLRLFSKYLWAILHRSGRIDYPSHLRHTT
ncbi:MAG TPA: hypothetical protein DCP31_04180, partial [Cyanobacteria bacterium UBA8543]|nr:hypothetical protein [Cyanobacteria bacterium UBA8543]